MQKMISLILEDGRKVVLRLIDYLESQVDGRHYVIVGNKLNTAIKAYEVRGNKAIILTAEEMEPFKNYLSNSSFKSINGEHMDELYLMSVDKEEIKEESETQELKSIIYYVFDHDVLRSYTADMDETDHTLSNVRIVNSWNQVKKDEIDSIVSEQNHEEVVYIVYDKMSDMDFFDGKTVLLHWAERQPKKVVSLLKQEDVKEQAETVILYVYDSNVVKKYQGSLVSKKLETMQISNIKAIQVINVEGTFEVEKFMASDQFEEGAYFAKFGDIYMEYKKEAGNAAQVNVSIEHFLQKKAPEVAIDFSQEDEKEKEEPIVPPISEPEESIKEKVILFEGVQRQGEKNEVYPISGVVCILKSQDPFRVVPEHNGVRTISFEDPNTRTFKDTCQAYQNLYPNTPVYLVNDYRILDGKEQIIDKQYLTSFQPQMQLKPGTALTDGKRVLTEDEMAKKRQEELKKIRISASKVAQLTGKKTGQFKGKNSTSSQNNKKKRQIRLTKIETAGYRTIDEGYSFPLPNSTGIIESKNVIRLSQAFKKHYPIVNGVNDDILHNIEKLEQLGHTYEEIVKELNLPYALVDQLSVDIPELKNYASLPNLHKIK